MQKSEDLVLRTRVLAKGKQLLLLIRHLPCYLYVQSSLVKVLAVRGNSLVVFYYLCVSDIRPDKRGDLW